ncbi:MAG TPA: cyclodeaminase/cyclohydrolase family protein [Fastidiosipila sp.]|jgi:formiminotetrahydrofolate cyclodeaminase|nr:cyclodeaminase/cyclohydrolase family protein [Fastidiosipila sp.]
MKKLTIETFVEELASNAPVPGGGGASALVGAIGVALGNMVGSLTVGKKKYADVEEEIKTLKEKSTALQDKLLQLVEEDAKVFEPLSRAYGLPSGTDEEKAEKAKVLEEALNLACSVPMQIMETIGEAVSILEEFNEKGSRLAISDVGCGAICCQAALRAASLNVFINTKLMKDKENADKLNEKANALLEEYKKRTEDLFLQVESGLKG